MRGPTPACSVEHSARRHPVNQRAAAKEPEGEPRSQPWLRTAPACEVQPGSTSVSALRMPSQSASRTFSGDAAVTAGASCAACGRVGCFCCFRCSRREVRRRGERWWSCASAVCPDPPCVSSLFQPEGPTLPRRTPGVGFGLQLRRVASAEAAGNVGLGGAWSQGGSLGGSFGLGPW